MSGPLEQLRAAVVAAAAEIGEPSSEPTLERPRQAGHGDFSTNAAMLLAKGAGAPPREIAERLAGALAERLGEDLTSSEVAGPGFLNLMMSDGWHRRATARVLRADFGGGGAHAREKINVEFVSANPTGPVHVGGTRNAAYGDALARMLEFHGHEVTREFYVNDYGSQVVRFAESLRARARGEEVPEGGYQGDYVAEGAREIDGSAGPRPPGPRARGVPRAASKGDKPPGSRAESAGPRRWISQSSAAAASR